LCATARRYDAVRDQFQTEIETLSAQFREHHRTLTILESEILPRAEETLKLALESYRAGRADFQQLMDVYRTLLRYRIDSHRHLALSEQALASLERAVGCAVTSQDGTDLGQ
jgi:outer membrane protein TolC